MPAPFLQGLGDEKVCRVGFHQGHHLLTRQACWVTRTSLYDPFDHKIASEAFAKFQQSHRVSAATHVCFVTQIDDASSPKAI